MDESVVTAERSFDNSRDMLILIIVVFVYLWFSSDKLCRFLLMFLIDCRIFGK